MSYPHQAGVQIGHRAVAVVNVARRVCRCVKHPAQRKPRLKTGT